MKTGWFLTFVFALACILGIYLLHRAGTERRRADGIEAFLSQVCVTAAANVGTDYAEQSKNAQECAYGNHSLAKALSAASDAQLIQKLIAYCISHGGIANVDRIHQKFDAINGKITSDEDICRRAVRTSFPEF